MPDPEARADRAQEFVLRLLGLGNLRVVYQQ